MARPMRTPVKWDRGSVSVAPIAQPFKGILEDFGIPEAAYSAEGGFGGSGLLGWEPAEFISPDVVWGTKYVSGAPPPSEYGDVGPNGDDNGKKCGSGFHGTWPNCIPDDDNGDKCPDGYTGTPPNCVKTDKECPSGWSGTWPNCYIDPPEECPCGGVWPNCFRCTDDGGDNGGGGYRPEGYVDETWTDEEVAAGEFDTGPSGPSGPSWADVVAEEAAANAVAAAAAADQERENAFLDTFDYTYVNPFAGYDPVEDYGVQGEFYDPWAFEDIRGGRR